MVCRTQILVSCNTAERWLEIRYPSMWSWARARATFTGRKWGRRPYWEIEGVEASTVASSAGLALSSNWAIARRSFARGQRDLGEGGLVALEHKQKNGHVWEMRQAKIRRFKKEGGVGAVWAHRNLHRSAAAEADLEL
jgi:hypothetical protein